MAFQKLTNQELVEELARVTELVATLDPSLDPLGDRWMKACIEQNRLAVMAYNRGMAAEIESMCERLSR